MEEFTAHKPNPKNLTMESWDQPKLPSGLLSHVAGHLLVIFTSESVIGRLPETSLSSTSERIPSFYAQKPNANQGADHHRKPRL